MNATIVHRPSQPVYQGASVKPAPTNREPQPIPPPPDGEPVTHVVRVTGPHFEQGGMVLYNTERIGDGGRVLQSRMSMSPRKAVDTGVRWATQYDAELQDDITLSGIR